MSSQKGTEISLVEIKRLHFPLLHVDILYCVSLAFFIHSPSPSENELGLTYFLHCYFFSRKYFLISSTLFIFSSMRERERIPNTCTSTAKRQKEENSHFTPGIDKQRIFCHFSQRNFAIDHFPITR